MYHTVTPKKNNLKKPNDKMVFINFTQLGGQAKQNFNGDYDTEEINTNHEVDMSQEEYAEYLVNLRRNNGDDVEFNPPINKNKDNNENENENKNNQDDEDSEEFKKMMEKAMQESLRIKEREEQTVDIRKKQREDYDNYIKNNNIKIEIVDCDSCTNTYDNFTTEKCPKCNYTSCLSCLAYWYKNKLVNHQFDLVSPCTCKIPVVQTKLIEYIGNDPKLLEKYNEYVLRNTLMQFGKVIYCPKPKCSNMNVVTDIKQESIVCDMCKYNFCSKCMCDSHNGKTCDEAMDKSSKEFYNWTVKNKSTKCPICSHSIEKESGCNRMTCGKCEAKFCFKCSEVNPKIYCD